VLSRLCGLSSAFLALFLASFANLSVGVVGRMWRTNFVIKNKGIDESLRPAMEMMKLLAEFGLRLWLLRNLAGDFVFTWWSKGEFVYRPPMISR
jgi:hypothetical protein